MPLAVLALILIYPVLEIASLIEVGRQIGLFPTLLLLGLGVLGGIALIRSQSFGVAARVVSAARAGKSPAVPLADSGFLVIAGLLLIIPGFVSDALALLLMLPPVRSLLASRLGGEMRVWSRTTREGPDDRQKPPREDIIDVEFREVTAGDDEEPPKKPRPAGNSPWRGGAK
jgi:UPF0716 protein FxsA